MIYSNTCTHLYLDTPGDHHHETDEEVGQHSHQVRHGHVVVEDHIACDPHHRLVEVLAVKQDRPLHPSLQRSREREVIMMHQLFS